MFSQLGSLVVCFMAALRLSASQAGFLLDRIFGHRETRKVQSHAMESADPLYTMHPWSVGGTPTHHPSRALVSAKSLVEKVPSGFGTRLNLQLAYEEQLAAGLTLFLMSLVGRRKDYLSFCLPPPFVVEYRIHFWCVQVSVLDVVEYRSLQVHLLPKQQRHCQQSFLVVGRC